MEMQKMENEKIREFSSSYRDEKNEKFILFFSLVNRWFISVNEKNFFMFCYIENIIKHLLIFPSIYVDFKIILEFLQYIAINFLINFLRLSLFRK